MATDNGKLASRKLKGRASDTTTISSAGEGNRAMVGSACHCYCNFAYSASDCFRMGISGSASFQSVRKS